MTPKVAVICYHKNLDQMYPWYWIEKFRQSILRQSHKDFSILELNYGDTPQQIFPNSYFESFELPNFAHAMNYLLDKAFAGGYDYVFNTNCDDEYALNRIEIQMPHLISGCDIVSSNFCLTRDDKIVHTHYFHELDPLEELKKDHNILCHPVIGYSKNFWKHNRYYPEEIPFEDMQLWRRALEAGFNFRILPDLLCFHRLHEQSVGHKLGETA